MIQRLDKHDEATKVLVSILGGVFDRLICWTVTNGPDSVASSVLGPGLWSRVSRRILRTVLCLFLIVAAAVGGF